MYDVIIAGGGPAGLQAALILGGARRRVLLCDTGEPRNASARTMRGFLSRDGHDPAELRRAAREELERYDTVELRAQAVVNAQRAEDGFVVTLQDGSEQLTRRIILATGVVDKLPAIDGLAELWGRSVFNCPFCDGWECRDTPLAVIGAGAAGAWYALHLTGWSRDLVLCTNAAPDEIADEDRQRLAAVGIAVRDEPILSVEALKEANGVRIVFADGAALERRAIFTRPPTRQRSDLAAQLACNALEDGSIEVNDFGQTSVQGVYAAGDMARRPSMPFPAAHVIHAASAGGVAAVMAQQELFYEEVASLAETAR